MPAALLLDSCRPRLEPPTVGRAVGVSRVMSVSRWRALEREHGEARARSLETASTGAGAQGRPARADARTLLLKSCAEQLKNALAELKVPAAQAAERTTSCDGRSACSSISSHLQNAGLFRCRRYKCSMIGYSLGRLPFFVPHSKSGNCHQKLPRERDDTLVDRDVPSWHETVVQRGAGDFAISSSGRTMPSAPTICVGNKKFCLIAA
jgi:hypothetical protein